MGLKFDNNVGPMIVDDQTGRVLGYQDERGVNRYLDGRVMPSTEDGGGQVVGGGEPSQFTSRALASSDNGAVLVCASAQAATVPSGLPSGFGCSFKGTISFTAGSGVTVTDVRTTGAANPWCALVQTAANTYDVVGGKA